MPKQHAETVEVRAGTFLADAKPSEYVDQMYASDRRAQGYVAHLTELWAHNPEALATLSHALSLAVGIAGLDVRTRALLTAAGASSIDDSYCSLAWGSKLAARVGDDAAAGVLRGDDSGLDATDQVLADWARRVTRQPNAITPADVDRLRQVGYADDQIFAITLFVALRLAYSTVNDALGAAPDRELAERAPAAVRDAVSFGRMPG